MCHSRRSTLIGSGEGVVFEVLEQRRLFSSAITVAAATGGPTVTLAAQATPRLRVAGPVLRQGIDSLRGMDGIEVVAPDHIGAVIRFKSFRAGIIERVVDARGIATLEANVLSTGEHVVSATLKDGGVYLGQVRVGIVSEQAWQIRDNLDGDIVAYFDKDKESFFVKYPMPDSAAYKVTEDGMTVRAYRKPPGTRLAGAGDINGDGNVDLIWQANNGAVIIWYMRPRAQVGRIHWLTTQPRWTLFSVRDEDGDGDADLRFTSDRTKDAIWYNDGGRFGRVFMQETLSPMLIIR